jgi:hypothetical protein
MAFRMRKGGKQGDSIHRPSEHELIALGLSWAMVMCHCGGKYTSDMSDLISDEVKRAEGSTQNWTNAEVCALRPSLQQP